MKQQSLDFTPAVEPPQRFDGETFEPEHDRERLGKQLKAVRDLMLDGEWRTLWDLERVLGFPQASISARIRDLRKERFGGHCVERRRRGNPKTGLYEYRIHDMEGDE